MVSTTVFFFHEKNIPGLHLILRVVRPYWRNTQLCSRMKEKCSRASKGSRKRNWIKRKSTRKKNQASLSSAPTPLPPGPVHGCSAVGPCRPFCCSHLPGSSVLTCPSRVRGCLSPLLSFPSVCAQMSAFQGGLTGQPHWKLELASPTCFQSQYTLFHFPFILLLLKNF